MWDRLKKAGFLTTKKAKTDANEKSWGDRSFKDWEKEWEKIDRDQETASRTHRSSAASSSDSFGFTPSEQEKMWGPKDKGKGNKNAATRGLIRPPARRPAA